MNPILQMLGQSQSAQTRQNDPMQLIQQFAQFRQQMQGKDPQAIVQQLLTSGKMTPQQFEQLKKQAQTLQSFLK